MLTLLNFEDDLVDLLLEHHYLTTTAIHLYLVYYIYWFLYLSSLGDQCLFLIYP